MKAKYLGLDLSSPVVVSSSPYTATVSNIEQCVRNGAGAVVLKSIFEEQIIRHAAALDYASQQGMGDSGEYLERYIGDAYKGEFLKLVADARTLFRNINVLRTVCHTLVTTDAMACLTKFGHATVISD